MSEGPAEEPEGPVFEGGDADELSDEEFLALLEALGAPGAGLQFAVPDFRFTLEVPPGFRVFRADAAHLRSDVRAACEGIDGWRSMPAAQQTQVRRMITDTVVQAAASGVFLTAIGTGRSRAGTGVTFTTLTLGWLRTVPVAADLELAYLVAGPAEHQVEFGATLGRGVLTAEVARSGEHPQAGLGLDSEYTWTVQAYVPLEGEPWLALVTGTALEEELAETLEKAVQRMAASIAVGTDG